MGLEFGTYGIQVIKRIKCSYTSWKVVYRRNARVVLITLVTIREISCSEPYCTEILQVPSPDDEYIEIALQKPSRGKSIERDYMCSKKHVNKVYWRPKKVKYTGTDFLSDVTPLGFVLLVPTVALWFLLTLIKLDPTQSTTVFETVVFFVFLLTVLGFLYAMKWLLWEESYDEALGLPQGSIRTVIALSVVFFVLLVGIFKLILPDAVVTLLAALVAFYFGASTAKSK
jgi:hypothetical protein